MIAGSTKPMAEKLKKYKLDPLTGCWLWTGSVDKDGYGRTGVLNPMFGKKHSPEAIAKMSQPKPRRIA